MEGMLEPCDGGEAHGGSTECSLFAERLVTSFLDSGMESAKVLSSRTGYGADKLYHTMRRVAMKKSHRGSVDVRKRGEYVILLRKR